jgi:hypothetical protein
MSRKALQPEEGEQILLNCNYPITFVCCGCGLTHTHEYSLPTRNGFLRARIWIDKRRTAAYRRHRDYSNQERA